MAYSVHLREKQQVPALAALAAIAVFIGIVVFVAQKDKIQTNTTQQDYKIVRSDIANVRDNTVSIFWRTDKPTRGYIEYGISDRNFDAEAFDVRDKRGSLTPRHNHLVVLDKLHSDTTYYYNIIVEKDAVGQTADLPFIFKTTRAVTKTSEVPPIYGEVMREGGEIASNSVVVMNIESAFPFVTLTKDDGSFLFSPCCIFDSSSREPMILSPDDDIVLEVIDEDGYEKKITADITQLSPLDTPLVLGTDDSNLSAQEDKLYASDLLAQAEDVEVVDEIDIIYPKEESNIPGTQPLIKGVGEPGSRVKGIIEPEGKIFELRVGGDRVWSFLPSFDLQPGKHTLSVTTEDVEGNEIAMERIFNILKSGQGLVLGEESEATPSGTITPSAQPTEEPEPTKDINPTQVAPTNTPTPPVTGINVLPLTIASVILIMLGVGLVFVL